MATVFYKIVFPLIWIGGFGLGAIASRMLNPDGYSASMAQGAMIVCISWMLGSLLILWVASRVRTVWLEGESLVVKNYRTETRIPLSAVKRISETRMWNPKMITLHLEDRDDLPEQVEFIGQFSFKSMFTQHPAVKELQDLVDRARKNPAKAGDL
jgi:hypothetical protein